MTERTKELISTFSKSLDVNLLPSIIIGIQEDDSLSTTIQFKNSVRLLRNLSAHESEVITSQIVLPRNVNSSKLCFIPNDDQIENRVTVDIVQFTAWMFDAAMKFDNAYYLLFWRSFVSLVCPNIKRRDENFEFTIAGESDLQWLMRYDAYNAKTVGAPKAIAIEDPYMQRI